MTAIDVNMKWAFIVFNWAGVIPEGYINEKEELDLNYHMRPMLFDSWEEAREWAVSQPHDSDTWRIKPLHDPVTVLVKETDNGLVITPLRNNFTVK